MFGGVAQTPHFALLRPFLFSFSFFFVAQPQAVVRLGTFHSRNSLPGIPPSLPWMWPKLGLMRRSWPSFVART